MSPSSVARSCKLILYCQPGQIRRLLAKSIASYRIAYPSEDQQTDPELDQLGVPEIQARFVAAKKKLQSARQNFKSVMESRSDNAKISAALTERGTASMEAIKLVFALARKGVFVKEEVSAAPTAQP